MGYYITPKGLQAVKTYKYDGLDKSLIANYIMQPLWRNWVNWLPLWMAPNVVTLIGFVFIIISYVTTAYFHPNITSGQAPAFIYLCNAFFMFIYQTMDALDGKQARRTGTSSPLGELFDHGCDAVTTFLSIITIACALTTSLNNLIAAAFSILIAFYLTQWEEYHTGKLVLGYIGVTEAQIASMTIFLMTVVFGPAFWKNTITIAGVQFYYGTIPPMITIASSCATILSNFIEVYKHTKLEKRENPGEPLEKFTFFEALGGTASILSLTAIFVWWAYFSPANVYSKHPHEFILTFGFLVANLVGRIVIARVCHEPFPTIQKLLFPVALIPVAILTKGAYFQEENLLVFLCLLGIGAYFHFAYEIIKDLCGTLKIRCFHIPYPKEKK